MGEGKPGTHPGASVPWSRGLACYLADLTRSLYSARLRMTAVICWSMKMRIDSSRAGRAAATLSHQGLVPKDDTSQSRPGSVGWGRAFHGQIGEGLPRAPHPHIPALAFFHTPSPRALPAKTWTVGGSSACACTAGSKHPGSFEEGGRRETRLGLPSQGFWTLLFWAPPSLQGEEEVGEACPYFLVNRALLPRHLPLNFQGGVTQAQTCLDLGQGQGEVCLRLL